MPKKEVFKFVEYTNTALNNKTSLLQTVTPASIAHPETLEPDGLVGKSLLTTPTDSLEITKGLSDEAYNDTNKHQSVITADNRVSEGYIFKCTVGRASPARRNA